MVKGLKNSAALSVPTANIGPRNSINWAYQLMFGQASPVRAITITNYGTTAYTVAPTVVFTGGVGTGATAIYHLTGGGRGASLPWIEITDGGTGFTSPPVISFTGGDGVAVAAIATLNPGYAAYSPAHFPAVIVPLGCSVTLRGGNGTQPNTANVFVHEYPDGLTQPGRIIISPDTEISYPVDNLSQIWAAGAVGDGLIATVRGAALG